MNRSTAIGRLWREDRAAARALVLRTIRRCGGHIGRAAIELGYRDRVMIYRVLWREGLWTEVDRIRADVARGRRPRTSLEIAAEALVARRGGPW